MITLFVIYIRYKSYNTTVINRPGSATTPCCKLKTASNCFYFSPCSLYVAAFSFFAIRPSFACGEGALAATAATAAAAALRCSFSLIISVLSVVVMVCLLCCLFCVTLALLLLCYYSCNRWSCWNIPATQLRS